MEACPRLLRGNHYQVQNGLALNSKLLKTRQGFPKVMLVLLLSQVDPVENLFFYRICSISAKFRCEQSKLSCTKSQCSLFSSVDHGLSCPL